MKVILDTNILISGMKFIKSYHTVMRDRSMGVYEIRIHSHHRAGA